MSRAVETTKDTTTVAHPRRGHAARPSRGATVAVFVALALSSLVAVPVIAATESPDMLAVKDLVARYEAAWNAHDPFALAALWDAEGAALADTGHSMIGRQQTTELLAYEDAEYASATLSQNIVSIEFTAANFAIVTLDQELVGPGAAGAPALLKRSRATLSVAKRTDRWAVVSRSLAAPPPSALVEQPAAAPTTAPATPGAN